MSICLRSKSNFFLALGPSPSKPASELRNYFLVGDMTFFIKLEGLEFPPPTSYDKLILTGPESYFYSDPFGLKI